MGSRISEFQLIVAAVACGALYLLFDAARYFLQQVSSVRLRRWSGSDPQFERGSRWFHYDPQNFSLLSGALLQTALISAVGFTILAFQNRGIYQAATLAMGIGGHSFLKFFLAVSASMAGVSPRADPVSHLSITFGRPVPSSLYPRPVDQKIERRRRKNSRPRGSANRRREEEGIIEEAQGKLSQFHVDFGIGSRAS